MRYLDPQIQLTQLTSLLSRIPTPPSVAKLSPEAQDAPPTSQSSIEAYVLLLATIAHTKLVFGDLEGTKTDMDAAWDVLDRLDGVENGVRAAYYGVAADYYKVSPFNRLLNVSDWPQAKAEYAPYYRNSLLYLACVDPATDMSPEERLARAHDLAISAFLGDTIYNFGELVSGMHCGSYDAWLTPRQVDAPYLRFAR